MAALAVIGDVEAVLVRAIPAGSTTYVNRLLELASGVFRREAGQTISAVNGDVVTLAGTWDEELWLPERPVTAVDSVTVDGTLIGSSVYQWSTSGRLYRPTWGPSSSGSPRPRDDGPWGGSNAVIVVTYDHGWTTIPLDVVMAVAEMVAARVSNPDQLRSQSVEDFSESYGASGGFGMTDAHKALAASLRPPVTSIPIATESSWC